MDRSIIETVAVFLIGVFCGALASWLPAVIVFALVCEESNDPPESSADVEEEVLLAASILPVPEWDWRRMMVTAYCQCERCCSAAYSDGVTASGHPVTYNGGIFAAAPPDVPFGTVLNVPGYGEIVPVIDRGGSIRGNKLDVFFADDPDEPGSGHSKALEWGRRMLDVGFPKKGDPADKQR